MKKLIEMVAIEEKIRQIQEKKEERVSAIEQAGKLITKADVIRAEFKALQRQHDQIEKEIDKKLKEIDEKFQERDTFIELASKHITEIEVLSMELKALKK